MGDAALVAYKRQHLDMHEVTDRATAAQVIAQVRRDGHPISLDFETACLSAEYGVTNGTIRLAQIGLHDPASGRRRQYLLDLHSDDMRDPLAELLRDEKIEKRIHFSRFEQEHAVYHLGQSIRNVYDTHASWQSVQKVLGQMLKRKGGRERVDAILPGWERTGLGLADVTRALTGLQVPKDEQRSDWTGSLTASQREYAATDVSLPHDITGPLRKLTAALNLDEEVADKCRRREQSTLDKWTPEQLDVHSAGREVCWQLAWAQSAGELDRVWRQARRAPVSYLHRAELAAFYAARLAELDGS